MIQLQCQKHIIPLSLQEEILQDFQSNLIFYLFDEKDNRNFFPFFVFLDFQNKQIVILNTFLKENESIIEKHDPKKEMFRILGGATPHQIIQTSSEEFLVFSEQVNFLYQVNIKNLYVNIFTSNEIAPQHHSEHPPIFTPTIYPYENNSFIFGLPQFFEKEIKKNIILYKTDFYLKNTETVGIIESFFVPHTTRFYKGTIYNVLFDTQKIIDTKTNKEYTQKTFFEYALQKLFQEYCECIGESFDETVFTKECSVEQVGPNYFYFTIPKDFEYFLESQYQTSDIFILLFKKKKYRLTGTPGNIIAYDVKTHEQKRYFTSKASPAHFEIDTKTDEIYVSNHNFGLTYKGRVSMLGPAAIDKFKITKNGLEKIQTFEHPEGYRFTTHVLFQYKNKKYIATMGQPNRIFFIDAETMELEYFDTIEEDFLKNQNDIHEFLISSPIEGNHVLKCIQASKSGEYFFILGHENIYFYSFPERKIVETIPYQKYFQKLGLHDLYRRTAHCHFIDYDFNE